MLNAKPMASLSPTLLARKGQARPAMRRQSLTDLTPDSLITDDLGWNDMGEGEAIVAAPVLPPVLEQRRQLVEDFSTETSPAETPVMAPPLPGTGRRAAFTLRLDAERHLRLRLASATSGRSAQKLVTEALDTFFATLPGVAALHAHLAEAKPPIEEQK